MSGRLRQTIAIPNLYGYFRILLVPEFIWLYLGGDRYTALAILVLSGISDFLDGRAARSLGMITPLGKVLDPIADRLTQFAVVCCLAIEYDPVIFLLLILAVKETTAAICGAALLTSGGSPFSALWYGKLSTGAIYAFSGILLLGEMEVSVVFWLTIAVSFFVLVSFVLYTFEFIKKIVKLKKEFTN